VSKVRRGGEEKFPTAARVQKNGWKVSSRVVERKFESERGLTRLVK